MRARAIIIACLMLVATVPLMHISRAKAGGIALRTPEKRVLGMINNARARRGLHRLRIVKSLERAARSHSASMLSRDYFSHYSYGGATYARRLLSFGYSRAGMTRWTVGEVIGWGKGGAGSARAVFRAWMRSSAHRAVIFTRCFRDCGVGAKLGSYATISGVRMFTVDFGRRY